MSENLLKALLELFAIIAKEGSVTEDERNNIRKFLTDTLSEESADRHLKMFDDFTHSQGSTDRNEDISRICKKINEEFTYPQKIILALQLIELILADGEVADEEIAILDYVSEKIKLPAEIIAYIQAFALAKNIEDFESDKFLIVAENNDKIPDSTYFIQEDHLDGFLAILKLSGTEMYFVKYLGTAQLNMNGIPLRKNAITLFPSGSTIKGEKSQTGIF